MEVFYHEFFNVMNALYCHLFLVFMFLVPLKVSGPEIEQPQGDRLVDFFPQLQNNLRLKIPTFDERLVTSRPQANSQGAAVILRVSRVTPPKRLTQIPKMMGWKR